ncbi:MULTISPECIES: transketolase [unclassified Streptomyces]|uniref:transketolase n=1 Tax=unclassified Streptomyces TaxID=2593676 RepID=UPI00073B1DDC|nr:transketolase [Streptomyces sp. AVP053U2]ODA74857.1 Transketolase 2 [Streptomyces sp. AVP053U2]
MLRADASAAARFRAARQAIREGGQDEVARSLQSVSADIRRSILRMIDTAQLGHVGGDMSVTDILVTLFGVVLEVDPEQPQAPDRDRFILSKGHCAAALYSTLAWCGYFPESELRSFMAPLSALNGHPDRRKVPGVETNTGPLGHGFPVAVGCALAARLRGSTSRTVVVLGDGEMQEGSNWEAAMTAGHHGLSSLTAIVDRNRLQQGARTEETVTLDPLDAKWAAFGWEVRVTDGHDHTALLEAVRPSVTGKPVAVVANTVKGKGVSFMEDRVEWHHKVPTSEQMRAAVAELSR